MTLDIDARRLALLKSMSSSIPPAVIDATVVIVRANRPIIKQLGTGTLFRIADRSFVITAAHVVRQAEAMGSTLGISGSDGRFIAAAGQWFSSGADHENKKDDPFDLGIYPLNDEQIRRLTGKRFLRLEDVLFDEDSRTGFYVVFGFPGIWASECDASSEEMSLKAFQFATFSYEGSTSGLAGFDARHHLLLAAQDEFMYDVSGNEMRFRTRNGLPARLPDDLGGLSGCSVWKIGDLTTSVHSWKAGDARLVGILTGVYCDRAIIKATRWIAASTLLYYACPDLRRAIELHSTT